MKYPMDATLLIALTPTCGPGLYDAHGRAMEAD